MKNKKIVLPVIFGVMLLACVLKIIYLPTYFTFGCAGVLLIFFLNAVIQIDADIYVSKKEYNEAFEEWKTQRDLNPEIGKFKKKKRTPWTVYVGCALILGIIATPILMFSGNNYKNFIWSYKNDIKIIKENNMEIYGHFPSEIPDCAQNVEWKYYKNWFKSKATLRMNVDDEYIEELEETFVNKDRLFEFKKVENSKYGAGSVLGWFNYEEEGYPDNGRNGLCATWDMAYPENPGDALMYCTYYEDDGGNSGVWDGCIIINKKTNTVMYFAEIRGR